MKKKTLVAAAAVAAMFVFSGCGKEPVEIDLMDYVEVTLSGVNGEGEISVAADIRSIEYDVLGNSLKDSEREEGGAIVEFEETLKYDVDRTEGLSNGDILNFSVSYDEKAARRCGIIVTGETSMLSAIDGFGDKAEYELGEFETAGDIDSDGYQKLTAEVYILTEEEGGLNTPFFNNYRPKFYFGGEYDVTGVLYLPEGVDMCMPGDTAELSIELLHAVNLVTGLPVELREIRGNESFIVGTGTIKSITKTISNPD